NGRTLLPSGVAAKDREECAALYGPREYAPLWTGVTGQPTANARDALALLHDAAADALDPADYASGPLLDLARRLETTPPTPASLASFDVTMSVAMLRYFRHLHLGRVVPRALGFRLVVPAEPHDFVMLLASALEDQRITETAGELLPPLVQYGLL